MHCTHRSVLVVLRRLMVVALAMVCSNAGAQPGAPAAAISTAQSVLTPNGNFIVMPRQGLASRQSGLLLFVDTRWVNGYGYRPVEVTISSPKPTMTDHSITIQLHYGWDTNISVEQEFEFPRGGTRASTNVAVPTYEQSMHCFWWDVWIDGVKDIDLSVKRDDAMRQWGNINMSTSTLRLLAPGDASNQRTLASTSALDFEVLSLKIGDFPRRWIDYTCFDVVSISTAELQLFTQTNPSAFEAIEQWVRAGGQLWVSDVGTELGRLPEISKLLHVSDALLEATDNTGATDSKGKTDGKSGDATANQPAEVGWRPARFRRRLRAGQPQGFTDNRTGRTRWVADPNVIAALERDPNYVKSAEPEASDDENPSRWRPPDSSEWFVEQPMGLGRVRAFRGTNVASSFAHNGIAANANNGANGDPDNPLPQALAMGLRSTRRWGDRHGITPDGVNSEFAKLLVPGVGMAPVTEFQVLITLFVLVIGPLNYWILKRYKRLQLLVLTVPLAAGVATAALFAYAIISDGFATTVRVRSYTTLDQRTGDAACWSWLSYYSGLAPGKGLTMPADVAIYPILPSWGGESSGNRAIVWTGEQETLTGGWLYSRTPTQYLSVRSRKTSNRLDIQSGNGKMRVTNWLGASIQSLIAIDASGRFFAGEQLASESGAVLQPISRDDAAKRVADLVRNNEPEAPPALADSERDFIGRRRRMAQPIYGRYHSQFGEERSNEDLASRAIADLAGLNGRPALDLPPRTYVAITTTGPEVDTGISYAREVASFHVVVGQW